MRKKCYIYTRVSTAAQTEGYSLEAQTERLRKYADYKEMEVVREYCDAGRSGMSIKGRSAFMEMMDDIFCEKDEISCVLVFKLSRFGRNAADILKSVQLLMDFDVDLVCVEDAIDSSPQGGRLTLAILSAVAEMEHENITVQFMAARMQKLMNGGWPGGGVPYGYVSVNKELVVVPEAADLVRMIYQKYLEPDMMLNTVVGWMNENGYKRVAKGEDKVITSDFVSSVLGNPVYYGMIVYNRRTNSEEIKRNPKEIISVRGKHEAIVDEETWEAAREKRKRTGVKWNKTHSLEHEHILSGLLKCSVCGAGMAGTVRRRKNKKSGEYKDDFYYRCQHRRKIDEEHFCDFKPSLNQNEINAEVEWFIRGMIADERFHEYIGERLQEKVDVSNLEEERDQLKGQLQQVVGAKNKLLVMLDALDAGDKHYARKFQDMQDRLDNLYDRISGFENEIADVEEKIKAAYGRQISEKQLYQILQKFDILYAEMTDFEKKEFMQLFIDAIELYPEKMGDGRIIRQIDLAFPVYYEGFEGEAIRLLNENTVETVVLLQRKNM